MALLEYPGSTLLGVIRLLVDKPFRNKVIDKITDPVVKNFWVQEYSKYPDKFQSEAIAPIQNKVGRFLSSSMIRNIVGQVKSSINLREIMDTKKILFLNLAKGRIGEDNSSLLGAMIITKIQLAAMSRVDIPEEKRVDFYLYVDEFQNFATESFASILSEARKYRLDLIMAHQYIEQLGDVIRSAVFGNVGTLVAFRVGAEDSEFLAKEFGPRFEEVDLVNLPKYHVYMKLMIDGVASDPFSAATLPPMIEPEDWEANLEKLINVSREHYSSKKEAVEEKIIRWSSSEGVHEDENFRKQSEVKKEQVVVKKEENKAVITKPLEVLFPAICTNCGNPTEVKFKPDPKRPVYCKDCLKHIRKDKVTAKDNEGTVEKEITVPEPVSLNTALAMKPQSFKKSSFEPAEDNKNVN
jgi:CxxC-x17-CxxC domain-containing protein